MIDPQNTSPDVVERLTRMETKLDLWKEGITAQNNRSDDIDKDHEARIRILENLVAGQSGIARWKATTGLALFVALISLIPWIISLV